MKNSQLIDVAQIKLLLTELQLPTVKFMWKQVTEQSDKEG